MTRVAVPETYRSQKPTFLQQLPPFPQVALRALRVLADEGFDTRQVVDVLLVDAAFTSEILRISNSPIFSTWQQVKTLRHAVMILGRDRLRAITMTVAMQSFLKAPFRGAVFQRCWKHSLATALLSSGLAAICEINQDEAYTAGLLHDVGKLGLLMVHSQEYAAMLKSEPPSPSHLLGREFSRFGIDHCQTGWWLQTDWGLPVDLAEAAATHHDEPPREPAEPKHVVSLACRLATTLGFETHKTGGNWTFDEIASHLPTGKEENPLQHPEVLREAVLRKMSQL